jgi:uncharacterized membrane protein YbhN (UPF0104 family)
MALGLLAWTFRDLDVAKVHALIATVGAPALACVLVPMGLSLFIESVGWAWAFQSVGRKVPFWGLFRVRVTSEALAMTLPAGMLFCESTKPFLLRRHCGLAVEASVAGMAARKYLLLVSQSLYISGFALFGSSWLERASPRFIGAAGLSNWVFGAGVACGLFGFASSLFLHRGRIAERVFGVFSRLPHRGLRELSASCRSRFLATDGELARFFQGSWLRSTRPALAFLGGWLLEAGETYLILRLLGVELPFVAVGAFEVTLSFLRHVTFVLPAGLGVQDLGYVACLRAAGVNDPLVVGAAFVVVKRAKEIAWALLGYALLAADMRFGRAPAALAARGARLGVDIA